MASSVVLGEVAAIASAATWAFSSLTMAGLTRRLSAVAVSAMRLWCGVLFYVVLLLATDQSAALLRVGAGKTFALGASALLALGLGDTMYIYGMQKIGVSRASPISVTSYPILTLALAWALLGEQINLRTSLGALLVLGGIVLIVVRPNGATATGEAGALELALETSEPRTATPATGTPGAVATAAPPAKVAPAVQSAANAPIMGGLLLVLGAAVTWAISTIWLRTLTETGSLIVVNTIRVPVAAALLGGFAAGRGLLRPRDWRPRELALLALAGVMGSGAGSLLYVYALKEAGAGRSALLNSLSPVFALPLAAVFLKERATGLTLAGTGLALAGVWLVIG